MCLKSALQELSNDVLHDAKSKLCQKLLTRDDFPRTPLIGNILEIIDART